MYKNLLLLLLFSIPGLMSAENLTLQVRRERIHSKSHHHGNGGRQVLHEAAEALRAGAYKLVGLEDLWATALKEGRTLFSSKRLWAATPPAQTGDMLGQTTIGPWQITTANARELGAAHGIHKEWTDQQVNAFLESRPALQARIAADFIEESYREFGRRAPHAIQRYFWLDAFLQKKIGRGPWHSSVLAKSPDQMVHTGFYAKQILLGSRFNPEGLLYWLYRTGDEESIRDALKLWKQTGYPISAEDMKHCSCDPSFLAWLETHL